MRVDAAAGIDVLHDLIRCVREDSGFGGGFDFEIAFRPLFAGIGRRRVALAAAKRC